MAQQFEGWIQRGMDAVQSVEYVDEIVMFYDNLRAGRIEDHKTALKLGFSPDAGGFYAPEPLLAAGAAVNAAALLADYHTYPLIINANMENIRVRHVASNLFVFEGFDLATPLDSSLAKYFKQALIRVDTSEKMLITSEAIWLLFSSFERAGSIFLGLSEFLFDAAHNEEALCSYDLDSVSLGGDLDALETFRRMTLSSRLDRCSFETITRAILLKRGSHV